MFLLTSRRLRTRRMLGFFLFVFKTEDYRKKHFISGAKVKYEKKTFVSQKSDFGIIVCRTFVRLF